MSLRPIIHLHGIIGSNYISGSVSIRYHRHLLGQWSLRLFSVSSEIRFRCSCRRDWSVLSRWDTFEYSLTDSVHEKSFQKLINRVQYGNELIIFWFIVWFAQFNSSYDLSPLKWRWDVAFVKDIREEPRKPLFYIGTVLDKKLTLNPIRTRYFSFHRNGYLRITRSLLLARESLVGF